MQIIINADKTEISNGKLKRKNSPILQWPGEEGWMHKVCLTDLSFTRNFKIRDRFLFWVLRFLWDIVCK